MTESNNNTEVISRHPYFNPPRIQKLVWALVILAAIWSIYKTISLAWVSDDAFISFRYAKNFINGNGLVFNLGERVEGYTNFLWTILIAGGMKLGIEPIHFAQSAGIISYLLTVAIFIFMSLKISRQLPVLNRPIIPIAALAILLQYDFQAHATSCLETSFTTLLVSAGFALLILANSNKWILLSGAFLILSALSRPDAMIFYIMGIPFLLFLENRSWKTLLAYLIPLIILYVPYWIFRYNYYGYPFPNTYYAKSASLSYYSQGIIYLWLYVKTYYIFFLLPVVIFPAAIHLFKFIKKRGRLDGPVERVYLLSIFFIIPFGFYIVRTGGDFMFARFFIPITAIMFFLLEIYAAARSRNNISIILAAIIIVASVFLRWNQFTSKKIWIDGIADEPKQYSSQMVEKARIDGANLKKYLENLDVTVGFYGTKAMVIYYSDLPTAIECNAGLTDIFIAHQPLTKRGRIGHEKPAPQEYLLIRKINFLIGGTKPKQMKTISFDGTPAQIFIYENRVMNALKVYPGVQFTDFPAYLDQYISRIDMMPPQQVYDDFDSFKNYYFDVNDDSARLEAFLNRLRSN
jgi:hypothetical protein